MNNLEQIKQIYPNNYNLSILQNFKLADDNLNSNFINYYSCYKYYLENNLKEELNFKSLEEELQKNSLHPAKNVDFYKSMSLLKSNFLFLRNNIFLDRLTEEEFLTFQKIYTEKNESQIKQFVKQTQNKVITFDISYPNEQLVQYNIENNISLIIPNNALVIGLDCEEQLNKEQQEFLKQKEEEFSKILSIPVVLYNTKESYIDTKNISLPVGSIIRLKNSQKKLMIIGYLPVEEEKPGKIHDYMACLYPEGLLSSKKLFAFDELNIEKIIHIGLQTNESNKMLEEFEKIKQQIHQ